MHVYAFVAMGIASWFKPWEFSPAIHVNTQYVCAMNVEPPGTKVIVENVNNGRSSHCIVSGSGPCCGRLLDASPKVRDELGFTGLTNVRVYRVVGELSTCAIFPQPEACTPPSTPPFCVLDLPKKALVACGNSNPFK